MSRRIRPSPTQRDSAGEDSTPSARVEPALPLERVMARAPLLIRSGIGTATEASGDSDLSAAVEDTEHPPP